MTPATPRPIAGALCHTHSMEKTHAPAGSISLAFLGTATLVAGLAGAVGSLGLLFHASRSRPPFLMVLFVVWVLSPFVAIVFARVGSRRWPRHTQITVYIVMLVIALSSLAVYGNDALRPGRAQAAFVYIVVPLVSWLVLAIIVPIAAIISRKQSHRGS